MRTAKARLSKKMTADGLFEVWEDVALGTEYTVNLCSRRVVNGFNTVKKQDWRREIIDTMDGGWYPTELLDIMEIDVNEGSE